jgi:tetratricopeptide (TPR) repeat protein
MIRGDLDWVVMKALEKDRDRRYESVNSLANDILRHLANEPVEACPPSAIYRARLLLRRHKVAAIAVTAVAATLVAATVTSLWQVRVARRAEALSEQRLAAEQQAYRQTIAAIAYSLGDKNNKPDLEKIITQLIDVAPTHPQDLAELAIALNKSAEYELLFGSPQEAERLARRALEIRRTVVGERDAATGISLVTLGDALQRQLKLDEAAKVYEEAIDILRQHYSDFDARVMRASNGLLPIVQEREDQEAIDQIRRRAELVLARGAVDFQSMRSAQTIFAYLKQWKKAEQCSRLSIELEPDNSAYFRYCIGLLQVVAKDGAAYRATCQSALANERTDYNSRYMAAWVCLLSPDSGVDLDHVKRLADFAVGADPIAPAYQQAVAITFFRSGQFQKAHDRLIESIELNSKDDSRRLYAATSRLFLAMAQHHLNRADDAQASLRLAKEEAAKVLQSRSLEWDQRLLVKHWVDEAEGLILSDDGKMPPTTVPAAE